ncbi:DUF2147 domain-containing protein [Fibrella forsythiae]|uniref:DUF2147 domain-containing protein n=1 Tax=Fibrella forsythiae TaxID=2817061 RepID=A0ABS3JR10_9BACT|nr:DUF2147 domain-containing protein [Fibrella forsythiae]MBO0952433.1 DUF2147 domain-containing protein [Fibrella forsythiae]
MFLITKLGLGLLLCLVVTTAGQSTDASADRILGRWLFPKKQTCVEIYRENGRYFGRMAAISASCANDYGNINNQVVLTNLSYAGNEWKGGTMIHPSSGSKFDVEMRMTNANTLVATVYKGVRFISKELVLTRQQVTN